MESVFASDHFGEEIPVTILCRNIAGGRSKLTGEMFGILDSVQDQFNNVDFKTLKSERLISMFRRDAGFPVIESFIIKNNLLAAAREIGGPISIHADGESAYMNLYKFIQGVDVLEYNIPIISEVTEERPKVGEFHAVPFYDEEEGIEKVRFVEVIDHPTLSFTLQSLRRTDEWPMIMKVAEDLGVGAARGHGYGKFVVTHWGSREA